MSPSLLKGHKCHCYLKKGKHAIYDIFLLFVSLRLLSKAKFQQAVITGNDDGSVPMCYSLQTQKDVCYTCTKRQIFINVLLQAVGSVCWLNTLSVFASYFGVSSAMCA